MSTSKSHETPHFDTVYALLPSALKAGIDDLLSRATRESAVKHTLDQLVRFSLRQDATDYDSDSREEWDTQRQKVEKALSSLRTGAEKGQKRAREDASGISDPDPKSKKAKLNSGSDESSEDHPIFTLHSLSASSPVRKKVNITICRNTIRFTQAASGVQEASIALTSLTRAFLISTPGKNKPHWTVVILTDAEQNQIIFGLDAVPPLLITTTHPASPRSNPKGTEAKPALMRFFSHLPSCVSLQEPSTSHFRSAVGEPFLDAYLRAKDGHLLFFEDGILFGEKKPCMWIQIKEIDNVRSLSATGRTFSLFIKRVATTVQDEEGDDGEDQGEETEFSLIDGKNQDAVARWVQDNRHRFGIRQGPTGAAQNSVEVDELPGDEDTPEKKAGEDSEDLDDSDFKSDSESDGGSASSESDAEDEMRGEEAEEEAEAEEEEEEESGSDEDEEGGELDQTKHPLLRPGAMPKMSKAAINAVVGMVEGDLMGSSSSKKPQPIDEEEDVDELDD